MARLPCCRAGTVIISRKAIAQLIGRVFIQKAAVNLLSTVLDTPEFFWSAPDSLQTTYKKVCEYMELESRVEVLNNRFQVTILSYLSKFHPAPAYISLPPQKWTQASLLTAYRESSQRGPRQTAYAVCRMCASKHKQRRGCIHMRLAWSWAYLRSATGEACNQRLPVQMHRGLIAGVADNAGSGGQCRAAQACYFARVDCGVASPAVRHHCSISVCCSAGVYWQLAWQSATECLA